MCKSERSSSHRPSNTPHARRALIAHPSAIFDTPIMGVSIAN